MAELTFEQLYADLVNAANDPTASIPADAFDTAQFQRDTGKSSTWVHGYLMEKVRSGELERAKIGKRYYYWFVVCA